MKKVAFIIGDLDVGGAEMLLVRLAQYIDKSKYIPIVITVLGRGPLQDVLIKNNIKVICLNSKFKISIKTMIKLYNILKSEEVEVINSHSFNGHFYGTICAKLLKIKSIHTEHTLVDKKLAYQTVFHNKIKRMLHHFNYKIVAVSEEVFNSIIKKHEKKYSNVMIINNGVDTVQYSNKLSRIERIKYRQNIGISDTDFLLITVAALRPEKNHCEFLEVLKDLTSENKNIKLVLVGDGYYKENIAEKIHELSLSDQIILLGSRTDVKELLNCSDLFILPSRYEGLSLAVLESMAAGVPVIATNVGGNKQIINQNINGFLVDFNELSLMKEKVGILVNDRKLLAEMQNNSIEFVKNNYDFNITVDKYEKLFSQDL